jgi:hypothetical protein
MNAATFILSVCILSTTVSYATPFLEVVQRTQRMNQNPEARQLARERGLDIVNVTWEDTGRFHNSAVGPNISDMTIQVYVPGENGRPGQAHAMPVIRFPNFTDHTGDISPDAFHLLVGNEKGQPPQRITLTEFLQNPTLYLHDPGSWTGPGRRSLYAPKRDSKVLVSAQACFLPIPQQGSVSFNPVLFNYQSFAKDPAVLTVLVTPQGSSVTVIDNTRDAFESGSSWGQRLFFNQNGERASLTGERESDFHAREPGPRSGEPQTEAAGESGLNMVLVIQIPLRQREPRVRRESMFGAQLLYSQAPMVAESMASDVENAVIQYGEIEGPFTEIDGLPIERDERFPVRVTVQFYKATSNGVVSAGDLDDIQAQIRRVYEEAEFVGSLVTDGDQERVTAYDGPKVQPDDWWEQFWIRHQANTGDTPEEARRKLLQLLGTDFQRLPVTEPYLTRLLDAHEMPEGFVMRPRSRRTLLQLLLPGK